MPTSPKSRRAKSALDPKVFVKAAELLSTELFACNAISYAATGESLTPCAERDYFVNVLRPRNISECNACIDEDLWWEPEWLLRCKAWYGCTAMQEAQEARVIGLLLCAELVKDGFKPTPYLHE